MIHFDAHSDDYNKNKFDHGSFVTHAVIEKLINLNYLVQIGIRTEYNRNFGCHVLDADYVNLNNIDLIINKIISIV